jgi:hypothetical protein
VTDEREAQESSFSDPEEHALTLLSFEGGPTLDLLRELSAHERLLVERLGLGGTFAVLAADSQPGDGEAHPRDGEAHPRDGEAQPRAGEAQPGDGPAELSRDEQDDREREAVRRVLRLEEALTLARVRFGRVVARSPDARRRARWVAVALPREEAAALAREREERPLLWYDGERFSPWSAEVDAAPEPLTEP